ncbi:TPA: hypothetical protein MJB81_14200 [Klebsiella pneumoniae]|uniref:hypothetical protein n=1 Tax=Klebsiella pneumoniae complex TaxID=3390273 RepID=UPI00092D844A|nr:MULTISPECIES: hypothetical protein [Klebsiella]APM19185.1 hypothetical protein AGG42_07320 [Klebsiella pneumoniae]APP29023.1 hypothetical protein AGE86_28570 [Klebsiella pneumoniae]APV25471.1 hypothetical protein A6P56_14855 [Klebsiella pneumoniae]EIW1518551.1 hypothetical protein [Klebsiella pneumoniae]EIW8789023.1 hypothetical protein [Klebsiella pneumoniae]
MSEWMLKDELWKTIVAALPVIAAFWKTCEYVYQFLRSGKILKLKNYYKEYGEHLGNEDKEFISKALRKKIMTQLIGVSSDNIRNKLIYISNRCDLNLTPRSLVNLSRYLRYDGKYFYFLIDSGYRRKRVYAWITAVIYLAYALAPIKIYYGEVLDTYHIVILVIFSVGCFFLSFFLIKAYPSEKTIQGLNGKMLKVEGSKYNDI